MPADTENSRTLFHHTRATYKKALVIGETIYEAESWPMLNRERRLVGWAEQCQSRFRLPSKSASPVNFPSTVRRPVATDPPTGAEILKDVRT